MFTSIKRPIERVISSAAVARFTLPRIRDQRLILAYHGIVPEGRPPAGERALFVRQQDFARQLDLLRTEVDVVALDSLDEDGDGRPRVAITFDDAYAGAVNEGVIELVERNLPATFFVSPGRLDGHVFWWDALTVEDEVPDQVRRHALDNLGGEDEKVRQWASKSFVKSTDTLPAYARAATRSELAAAVSHPGISVGSHTWSHCNLTRLSESEVAKEVCDSLEWLHTQFGSKSIDWLAYPYGLDSPEIHRIVERASYAGAVRIDGGWHRRADVSAFARPRFSVASELSIAGFRARLRGALLT